MNTLQTIDFHGQPLLTINQNGTHYVAMKPICENLGLDWSSQHRKIQCDEVLKSTMVMMTIVAEDNKMREMTCLPIEYINGWLFGIDVNRVNPDLRETIILYKKECYQVLNNYWRNNDSETSALLERVAELEDLVHILLQHRLATPKEQPLSDEDIHALTLQRNRIMSKKTLRAAQNPAYAKRTTNMSSGSPRPSVMRFFYASMKGIRQFNGGFRAPNTTPSGNKRHRLDTVVEARHLTKVAINETKCLGDFYV